MVRGPEDANSEASDAQDEKKIINDVLSAPLGRFNP